MPLQKDESERIYYSLFRKKIPASIQYHFNRLSEKLENDYSEREIKKYSSFLVKNYDLEALEVAARYLKKFPLLTEKFKIMVYLAETLPENYDIYINDRNNRFFAYLLLIVSAFRSFYKLTKGVFLLTIYRP